MPKLKTHKGAAARFHISGTGKVMRMKQGKSHLRMHKPKRVKRAYDESVKLNPADKARLKKMMPYDIK